MRDVCAVVLLLLAVAALAAYQGGLGKSSPYAASAQTTQVDTTRVNQIGSRLVCQCGCNAVLINCPDQPTCPSWNSMLNSIKSQVAQGKSDDEIVDAFIKQYGEKVLVEPPKTGLNLVAYFLPFAGLVIGALLLLVLLRGWAARGKGGSGTGEGDGGGAPGAPGPVNDEYRQRVEKELKEMS